MLTKRRVVLKNGILLQRSTEFPLADVSLGSGCILLTASLLVPLVARIRAEERLLREHLGAEYDAYRARTWRLAPWIY
jgi:protein-S-isoprenylcysteine O-methyltransferase Ste14